MQTIISLTAQYFFVVPIALWLGWWFFSFSKQEKIRSAAVLAIALIVGYVFIKLGGHLYNNPRPFVVGNFTPYFKHAADNGFPSDHTIFVTVFAASMWLRRRWLSYILYAMTLIVGLSRVLSGVHHVIDVIGAMVLGTLAVVVAELIVRELTKRKILK